MKYFYIFIAFIFIALAVALGLRHEFIASMLSFIIALLSLSVDDIIDELKKDNKEVIVRDPKTGRFKKK